MKIGFQVRSFILAAAFSTGLGFGTSASAQERSYLIDLNSKSVTDIGTLGGDTSEAYGINDAGQVVGKSGTHAFITGPDGMGMRDLGTLGGTGVNWALGINDAGQVVGHSNTAQGHGHAFITGPNGMGMNDLGILGSAGVPGSFNFSWAQGINQAGQVVGFSSTAGSPTHAFITGPNGVGMEDIGTLEGTDSHATDINDAGRVVGFGQAGGSHAFITGPNGVGMEDLGTLGGNTSVANGINEAGQVVGNSLTAEGGPHAFITGPDGMGMRDLGTLADTGFSSALGINDAGQVVGYSGVFGAAHAFITGPDGAGMMDLNSLVDVPHGVILDRAMGINNEGQVIAIGVIPEPEIYALFLAGLALVGFIARRKNMGGEAFSLG